MPHPMRSISCFQYIILSAKSQISAAPALIHLTDMRMERRRFSRAREDFSDNNKNAAVSKRLSFHGIVFILNNDRGISSGVNYKPPLALAVLG